MTSYIPSRDADLLLWAENFRDTLAAAPATYALVTADITLITTLVNAFDTAYATAINPSTRTPATVAAKDSAKGAMLPNLRLYAQTIKLNPGISNADKIAAGIHINDPTPSPIPVPTSIPLIAIDAAFPALSLLDIRAAETPLTRAKPAGTTGLVLFATINALADPVPTDPTAADFITVATRNAQSVMFDAADRGKRVTFWGRWMNRRGELGPWSTSTIGIVA